MPSCYARRMAFSCLHARGRTWLALVALVGCGTLVGCTILDRLENGTKSDDAPVDASVTETSTPPEASADASEDVRADADASGKPDLADASDASEAGDAADANDAGDAADSGG